MAHKNNYYMIHAYIIYKVHACSSSSKRCWAFGYNHQESRHFQMPTCVLTCSPNIWLLTEKCDFQQATEFPGPTNCSPLLERGCDSSVWFGSPPTSCLRSILHMWVRLSISPHKNGSTLRKVMDQIHLFYSQTFVEWMNEWMQYLPCTCPSIHPMPPCREEANTEWTSIFTSREILISCVALQFLV